MRDAHRGIYGVTALELPLVVDRVRRRLHGRGNLEPLGRVLSSPVR